MSEWTLIQIGNIFIMINNVYIINDNQLLKISLWWDISQHAALVIM